MSKGRVLLIGVPAAVLVACLAGSFATRGAMSELSFLRAGQGAVTTGLVDQRPFQAAQALAAMAVSAEEQQLAREAERLADHEVDQAFAQALRQAEMTTRQLSGQALETQKKMQTLAGLVKEDQARVDAVTAEQKGAAQKGVPAASVDDDLDVAKAQLQLDTDELNDATADLARESGDKRDQIQQELTARNAAMEKYDAEVAQGGQTAVASERRFGTLAGRIQGWLAQRSRMALIEQAQTQAEADAASFERQHAEMQSESAAEGQKLNTPAAAGTGIDQAQTQVKRLGKMHSLTQVQSILDDRIATEQQLAAVYGKWTAQVELQHRILLHLMLQSIAWLAAVVLLGMITWWIVRRLLDRTRMDTRSLHTLRTIIRLGIQIVTLVLVLLVLFGPPDHAPTVLGLATAGLTVVFQDFILAFFGWFVLMGKNGIRVGDWVEINGVGGEVMEIGLFRTTLMETGNWTDKGHPTGRRVTFINNFAITGQYFNFSTAGQWLWDEISVNVPAGEGSHHTIEAIQKAVTEQTAKDSSQAESEWQLATKQRGLSQFSATPSVDVRPAASGTEVVVRYVTRAGERFETRNRLYSTLVDVLRESREEMSAAR